MDSIEEVMQLFDKIDDGSQNYGDCTVQSLLADIDGDIGGEEFKELAHEIALVAPQLKNSATENIFFSRSYIFSVNDGCGLDLYLKQMAALVQKLGLSNTQGKFEFVKLQRDGAHLDAHEDLSVKLRQKADTDHVCIDICDWMSEVQTIAFRNILLEISEICTSCIVVFRIPFVDKEVLNNVCKAINDVMFVRSASFPPYTTEQIDAIAAKHLGAFGFTAEKDAWKGFNARIREEANDGRFYGNNTVVKVVRELLYKKLLANASQKKASKVITAEDTRELCRTLLSDDKSGMEMLAEMVGAESVKRRIAEIVAEIELAHGNEALQSPCIHMLFVGNPGTGKTTVARILGKIFREKGILRVGEFFEHNGREFCGKYIGETAPKTLSMCREAYGSVLFIDEAYSLYKGEDSKDFGKEALDTLIAEMENHRNDMVVIMAGYTDDMERMLRGNVGLRSRLPYKIEFPNFTRQELYEIFVAISRDKLPCADGLLDDVKQYFLNLDKEFVESKNFSNARYVRNLYERTCAKAAMRCQLSQGKTVRLEREDFARAIADSEFANVNTKSKRIGFGN